MSETNEAALRAAVNAFNDPQNHAGWLELYAPDVVLHGYPRGPAGRDGAESFYSQVWRAFPNARLTIDAVLATGDNLAARYTLSGMQSQEFYGAPGTGAQTTFEGMAWMRFEDSRVAEVWQASGTLDFLTRLSARAALAPTRPSASAEAAALRWEEQHPDP